MSCTPLPKAAKLVWAKQLPRLPCLAVCVKLQFVHACKSQFYKLLHLVQLFRDKIREGVNETTEPKAYITLR